MSDAFIPSPSGNDLYLGPLFVHAYGLMYMLGVAAAVWLTIRRWGRRGMDRQLVYDVAAWAFPAGLLGERVHHLATSWNEVPAHRWGPIRELEKEDWESGAG